MSAPARVTVEPLTPQRWGDLETVFNARGCSVARRCWCMFYRAPTGTSGLLSAQQVPRNKRALKKLAKDGPPPGLIGYRDGVPVGWISLGPREHYHQLARSRVMKAVDDEPVWSVICFVVPSEYRGQGVAKAMLAAAKAWARKNGARILEAYPVEREGRGPDDSMWFGSRSMFDAEGFVEVARHKATRPILRLKLAR